MAFSGLPETAVSSRRGKLGGRLRPSFSPKRFLVAEGNSHPIVGVVDIAALIRGANDQDDGAAEQQHAKNHEDHNDRRGSVILGGGGGSLQWKTPAKVPAQKSNTVS